MGTLLAAPPDDEVYPNMISITSWSIRKCGKRGWNIKGEGTTDPEGPFDLHGLAADDGTAFWIQIPKQQKNAFRVIQGSFDLKERSFVGHFRDTDGKMGIVTKLFLNGSCCDSMR